MKFRKKPVVIEAVQYDGKAGVVLDFLAAEELERVVFESSDVQTDRKVIIRTLEGDMAVSRGDWIIRGIKGELYPCKPDIFAATYEKAD